MMIWSNPRGVLVLIDQDMEIITYILHGGLTHKDSMGSEETLGRASVQFMTAGIGVMHSE